MQQTHNDRKNHKCKCCHIRQEVEEEITDSEVTFNTPSRRSGITVKLKGTFGFCLSLFFLESSFFLEHRLSSGFALSSMTSLRHGQYGSETNRIMSVRSIIRHLLHVPVGLVIVRQQSCTYRASILRSSICITEIRHSSICNLCWKDSIVEYRPV